MNNFADLQNTVKAVELLHSLLNDSATPISCRSAMIDENQCFGFSSADFSTMTKERMDKIVFAMNEKPVGIYMLEYSGAYVFAQCKAAHTDNPKWVFAY